MNRNNSNYPSSLPQELMINILLLLPYESILQCKLVSKEWYNLINHRNFFNFYRDPSLALYVTSNNLNCVAIRHADVFGFLYPLFTVCPTNIYCCELISDPSNLIACVKASNGHLCFFNSLTGSSRVLTNAPLREYFCSGWVCYGFGYDGYDDDHKFLVVCDYNVGKSKRGKVSLVVDDEEVQNEENSLFWVYSLRDHAWRSFRGFPYVAYDWRRRLRPRAGSFNGFLHWVVSRMEDSNKHVIVTCDLHTYRHEEMAVPVSANSYDCVGNVGELNRQLCYWVCDEFVLHMWVMEEYGIVESWTKLFSIDQSKIRREESLSWMTPVALYEFEDGAKIVLFRCSNPALLVWYDARNNKMEVAL